MRGGNACRYTTMSQREKLRGKRAAAAAAAMAAMCAGYKCLGIILLHVHHGSSLMADDCFGLLDRAPQSPLL